MERQERQRYTLSVLSENSPGVLHRITAVFTRRSVNIESLTVSETERPGIARFTVVFLSDAEHVEQVLNPVRRMVEVIDAAVHADEELLFKEIAFIRAAFASQDELQLLKRRAEESEAQCVLLNGCSVVFEKTGTEDEINRFRSAFRTHRILAFIRSGRIAISRQADDLTIERGEDRFAASDA